MLVLKLLPIKFHFAVTFIYKELLLCFPNGRYLKNVKNYYQNEQYRELESTFPGRKIQTPADQRLAIHST